MEEYEAAIRVNYVETFLPPVWTPESGSSYPNLVADRRRPLDMHNNTPQSLESASAVFDHGAFPIKLAKALNGSWTDLRQATTRGLEKMITTPFGNSVSLPSSLTSEEASLFVKTGAISSS